MKKQFTEFLTGDKAVMKTENKTFIKCESMIAKAGHNHNIAVVPIYCDNRSGMSDYSTIQALGFPIRLTQNPYMYLAYITKVELKGKTIYEAKPMPDKNGNRLYNEVMQSDEKDFDPDDFINENPDCSIPLYDGSDLLVEYVKGYYSSAKGLSFLVKHGADTEALKKHIKDKFNVALFFCSFNSCTRWYIMVLQGQTKQNKPHNKNNQTKAMCTA